MRTCVDNIVSAGWELTMPSHLGRYWNECCRAERMDVWILGV